MEMQTEYLHTLQTALEANPAVKAAWLTGSFGRGNADRYSDVDLNIWLDAANLETFRQATELWLNSIRPLVLFKWMFNDRMANCLTVDGLRIDLWLHTDAAPRLDESRVQVMVDREHALQFGTTESVPDPTRLNNYLISQIREFWRCIAMLPTIGRDERIIGLFGLSIEVNVLTDVIIGGYGIPRDSGIKRLNPFLPDALRAKIEQALSFDGLTASGLVQAHLALARIMQEEGRQVATRNGFEYPVDIEEAALGYTLRELAALGLVTRA